MNAIKQLKQEAKMVKIVISGEIGQCVELNQAQLVTEHKKKKAKDLNSMQVAQSAPKEQGINCLSKKAAVLFYLNYAWGDFGKDSASSTTKI